MSIPVLRRLQEVLKDLMVQGESGIVVTKHKMRLEPDRSVHPPAGLTWKDDVTQKVISRELRNVPTLRPKLPDKSPKQ